MAVEKSSGEKSSFSGIHKYICICVCTLSIYIFICIYIYICGIGLLCSLPSVALGLLHIYYMELKMIILFGKKAIKY